MAFRWKAQKSGQSNLRRLARGQLRNAINELADPLPDQAEVVHGVRLRLKKLRSLLRLVRSAVPDEFRRENSALRDAARALATERDKQAVIEALGTLQAHAESEWSEPAGRLRGFRKLCAAITASQREKPDGTAFAEAARHVTKELRAALDRLPEWTVAADDEAVLVAGFADSYRRARRALRTVLANPTPAHLHEWRKQIKYHRYQARLFQDAWPAMFQAHCDQLKRLTDLLGDDHDLVVVRQRIETSAGLSRKSIDEVLRLAARRRLELQAEALPLGRLLLVEKPKRLTRRLMHYWCVYRDRIKD